MRRLRRGLGILIKLALVMFYGHRTGRRDGELAQSPYEAIVKLVKGAVHVAPLTGEKLVPAHCHWAC
jgi:hypothetical protein